MASAAGARSRANDTRRQRSALASRIERNAATSDDDDSGDAASTFLPGGTIRLASAPLQVQRPRHSLMSPPSRASTTGANRGRRHAAAADTNRLPFDYSLDGDGDDDDTIGMHTRPLQLLPPMLPAAAAAPAVASTVIAFNTRHRDFVNGSDSADTLQRALRPPWAPPLDSASAAKLINWTRIELRDEMEMRNSPWYQFAVLVAGRAGIAISQLIRVHDLVSNNAPPLPPQPPVGGLRPFGYDLGGGGGSSNRGFGGGGPGGGGGGGGGRVLPRPAAVPQQQQQQQHQEGFHTPPNEREKEREEEGDATQPSPKTPPTLTSPLPQDKEKSSTDTARMGPYDAGVAPTVTGPAAVSAPGTEGGVTADAALAALRNEVAALELRARRAQLLEAERVRGASAGAQWMNRTVATGVAYISDLLVAQRDKGAADVRDEYPSALGAIADERELSESTNADVRSLFADLVAVGITVAQYMSTRRLGRVTDYSRAYADARRAAMSRFRYVRRRNGGSARTRLYVDVAAKSAVRERQHAVRTMGATYSGGGTVAAFEAPYVASPVTGGAVPQWQANVEAFVLLDGGGNRTRKFRRLGNSNSATSLARGY